MNFYIHFLFALEVHDNDCYFWQIMCIIRNQKRCPKRHDWTSVSYYNWYIKSWYYYHSRTLNLKVSGLWLMTGFRERERKKNRKDSGYIEEIRHIIWKINGLTNRYRLLKDKKAINDTIKQGNNIYNLTKDLKYPGATNSIQF